MALKNIEQSFVTELGVLYPQNEAQHIWYLVIESLTGMNLRNNPDQRFTPDPCYIKMLAEIKKRLLKAEPVQYILNEAWFYDIPFYVDKNVLIPRPETEELADRIIREYRNRQPLRVLDIGTGSGCIPVILKRKLPQATVSACDVSPGALKVARKNAATHGVEIDFKELDILDERNWEQLQEVDVLVSNPPYIPETDKTAMHRNVLDHEPHLALFVPNDDPLLFYRKIAGLAHRILHPQGRIYLEVHEQQAGATASLYESHGFSAVIQNDLQGKQRFVEAGFKETSGLVL
ncbi:peptide chain release factor N(5)-glutamine methyltransferase [Niabella aurantiaca]|uniref:peptide chain release factor N(5)-glutamine methyltransferase n=1 Tax=Niabella aurantiaca TaxID=379900 RepID=UPI0003681074|nr:peptide chain release factor N(5)-glutamine methyltransferase [Niabella aurantiaca]